MLLIRLGIVGNITMCSTNEKRRIHATTCNDIVFREGRPPLFNILPENAVESDDKTSSWFISFALQHAFQVQKHM